jgi:hypothetical protein
MNDHIFIYWDDLPLDKPTGNEQDPKLTTSARLVGIEAKDVVMDFQPDNYNLGTALTYLMRAGKKPNNPITQDIRKAIAHLEFELERQIHLQSQDEQRATSTTNEGINVNYAVLY